MQILGAALGLFLGPRGCLGLIAFIAVPLLVNHRFGGYSGYWAFGAMMLLAVLPIGMRNGRAGLMRAAQAILALMIAGFGLSTLVGFYSSGFADGRAWMSAMVTGLCFLAYRGLRHLIARTDAAAMSGTTTV